MKILPIAILICFLQCTKPKVLIPIYSENQGVKYLNPLNGKFNDDCHFEDGKSFEDELASVKMNGKWGFIDAQCKFVIDPQFDLQSEFQNGLAFVKKDKDQYYIDKKGKIQTDTIGSCDALKNDYFANFQNPNDCDNILNIQPISDILIRSNSFSSKFEIYICNNGMAKQFLSQNLSVNVEETAIPYGCFNENFFVTREGYINKNGRILNSYTSENGKKTPFPDSLSIWHMNRFENDYASIYDSENNQSIVFDKTGKVKSLLPNKTLTSSFSENTAVFRSDNKFGFIDINGKEIIPNIYEDASQYRNGLAAIKTDGKWGYIDKTGIEAIKPTYTTAGNFSYDIRNHSLVSTEKGAPSYLIDKTGSTLTTEKYSKIYMNSINQLNYNEKLAKKFALPSKKDYQFVIDETELFPHNYKIVYLEKNNTEISSCGFINTNTLEIIDSFEKCGILPSLLIGIDNDKISFYSMEGKQLLNANFPKIDLIIHDIKYINNKPESFLLISSANKIGYYNFQSNKLKSIQFEIADRCSVRTLNETFFNYSYTTCFSFDNTYIKVADNKKKLHLFDMDWKLIWSN
ncbi:WG repeat-containing protein [Leptospira bouyouniensis]|uniref:WG repeat-containing protein n=1 Tax=Leptospira bouyouniensis TaxID=2484911 RepID=UPI0010911FAC|nr:WG repeat-containing protein [Leptospira bouyouniensis]TGM88704.1 WG repeat-containing protein [Leptospira bouyouniensis]